MSGRNSREKSGVAGRVEREEEAKQELIRLKNKAKDYVKALRWVMSDPKGRLFIATILKDNGVNPASNETSFTGNSKTYELEGKRKAAKTIETIIVHKSTEEYCLMLREQFLPPEEKEEQTE